MIKLCQCIEDKGFYEFIMQTEQEKKYSKDPLFMSYSEKRKTPHLNIPIGQRLKAKEMKRKRQYYLSNIIFIIIITIIPTQACILV